MNGVNRVILLGTIGKDPETRTFPDGGSITTITLATSDKWKDKSTGQQQERTEWHTVKFHARLAEVAYQYLRKGSKVYIEGSIRTNSWDDKQTGVKRYSTEIIAREMQMLDSASDSPRQQQQAPQQQAPRQQAPQQHSSQQGVQTPAQMDDFDDDIPF